MAGTVGTTTIDKQIFEVQVRDKASKEVKAIDDKVKKLEKSFLKMAANVAKSLTGTLLKAIINVAKKGWQVFTKSVEAAFKAAVKFQDVMLQAHQAMGLAGEAAKDFDKEIRTLALEIGGIPTRVFGEIAGTAAILGLRGTENIKEFTTAIAQLAASTDVIASKAAAQIPAILTVFGVATEDMGKETRRLADMITHLGFTFNATQSQILSVMTTLSGAAVTSKLTMEQFAALSTTVASVEKRFHTGGAAIQQILQRMATKSAEWAEILKLNMFQLSDAIENRPLEALKMIFNALGEIQKGTTGVQDVNQALKAMKITGVRAGGVLLKMVEMVGTLDKATTKAAEAQGALRAAYEIAMAMFSKQWQSLKNIGNEILLLFGIDLAEAVARFLELDLNPLLTDFAEWLETSEFIEETWPRILQEVKLVGIGLVAQFSEFFDLVEDVGPWEALKQTALGVWEVIKKAAFDVWDSIDEKVRIALGPERILAITNAWEGLKTVFKGIVAIFDGLKTTLDAISAAIDKIRNFFGKEYKNIQDTIKHGPRESKPGGGTARGAAPPGSLPFTTGIPEEVARYTQAIPELLSKSGAQESIILMEEMINDWQEMGMLEGQATRQAVEFAKSINMTAEAATNLAKIAYKESVFPEMSRWILKNVEDTQRLGTELERVNQILAERKRQASTIGANFGQTGSVATTAQISRDYDSYQRALERQIAANRPQEERAPGQQTSASFGAPTVNVTFQGTNVVDESSKTRFVREIVKTSQNLRSHVVFG